MRLKKWHENNPDKKKEHDLAKFDISPEHYNRMIIEQNNCCKICKKPETSKRLGKIKALAVDHCHKTGLVSGLLCQNCNIGLGSFKDSIDNIYEALNYLTQIQTDSNPEVYLPWDD